MREHLFRRLSAEVVLALRGQPSTYETWALRSGESAHRREELLRSLDRPSAESELHRFLKQHNIPRTLANQLLLAANIPLTIPAGAMHVLGLGCNHKDQDCDEKHTEDGSPLDWPVFWDTPGSRTDPNGRWFWRRTDRPIAAVQKDDGSWERQHATY